MEISKILGMPLELALTQWRTLSCGADSADAESFSSVFIGLNSRAGDLDKAREFHRRLTARVSDDPDMLRTYKAYRCEKIDAHMAYLFARTRVHEKRHPNGFFKSADPARHGHDQNGWFCNEPGRFFRLYPCDTQWYCDDFCEDTLQGYVLQMPSRKGNVRFLAAYGPPDCDMSGLTVLPTIYEGAAYRDEYEEKPHDLDAFKDAAHDADKSAEHAAEDERNWSHDYELGRKAAMIVNDDIRPIRRTLVDGIRAMAAELSAGAIFIDGIPFRLSEISDLAEELQEAREGWHSLRDDAYDQKAFKAGYHDEL